MKKALTARGACALSWLLLGCATPGPDSDVVNESVVITLRGKDVDFGAFQTYHVRPDVLSFSDSGGFEPLDASTSDALVTATQRNLDSRGYQVAAAPENADLGVQLVYAEQISTAYWCYSWWDPYYWGYPSYYYYPYYGSCDATVWRSGMLATVMVDLTVAQDDPEPMPGPDEPVPQVPGVWFSGVYAVSLSSAEARDGINQAFEQSPYLSASQ